MNTKQCTNCKETKTVDKFHKSSTKDGYDYYCKYCRTASALKSQRGGNKKKCSISECETHHYAKGMCRNHYTRWNRHGGFESLNDIVEEKKTYKYAKQQLTYRRDYMLMYKYKLSMDQFLEMSKNGCNICGGTQERTMQVDHDHNCCSGEGATCGQCVRGVLCNRCNQTVGKYEAGVGRDDNPLLDKVKEYLNGQKG